MSIALRALSRFAFDKRTGRFETSFECMGLAGHGGIGYRHFSPKIGFPGEQSHYARVKILVNGFCKQLLANV